MRTDRYKLFGVYLSPAVVDALADRLYETAGVVDLEGYFDGDTETVPAGDPGAEATDTFVDEVVGSFATCYDRADFEAARAVDPDAFALVHLAAQPRRITDFREKIRSAAIIQETDRRTVQTAVLAAALEVSPEGSSNS